MAKEYPKLWLAVCHHRNSHNQPMTFLDAPWSVPVYTDKSEMIVAMKSVQSGWTDWAIISMMTESMIGGTTLYVVPGEKDLSRLVNLRCNPVVDNVPFYAANTGNTDNIHQKRYFSGNALFVIAAVKTSFKEISATLLIVDELDECNQANLDFAQDRLAAAAQRGFTPRKYYIGNPTTRNQGIAAMYYGESDGKVWMLKCPHCNEWQPLDWFKNVIKGQSPRLHELLDKDWTRESGRDINIFCWKCGGIMDRHAIGEWVAQFQNRDASGYQQSKIFTAQTTIAKMYKTFLAAGSNPSKLQAFYNSELGIPYSASGSRIELSDLQACCDSEYTMPKAAPENCGTIIAGVDVGGIFHVSLAEIKDGKRRKLFIGAVPSWDEVAGLLKRYHVFRCVIDHRPEMHAARAFRDKFPGIVYLCDYPGNPTTRELQIDYVNRTCTIDKHASLDASYADYLDGRVILPDGFEFIDNGEFVKQMLAPIRKYVERAGGITAAVWDEEGQPDHYRHADNYEKIAFDMVYGRTPGVA